MRSVLYQCTQLAVAVSTWSRPVQERARSWSMSSVLYSPMVDSIKALSRVSPTVPIEGAVPASMSASVKLTAVSWLPASEWNTKPLALKRASWRRRQKRAWSRAESTSGVVLDAEVRQPRIRREHVGHEAGVHKAFQGPHVGEVGHPPLVDSGGGVPRPADQVGMAGRLGIASSGHGAVLASGNALDTDDAHEPGHLVAPDTMTGVDHGGDQLGRPIRAAVGPPQVQSGVGHMGVFPVGRTDRTGVAGVKVLGAIGRSCLESTGGVRRSV
jgi:hypothetical protein